MSHEIYPPIDEVYAPDGGQWHGLAKPPLAEDGGKIGNATVNRLCPKVRELRVSGEIDGVTVTLPNHKALVADYRECRPELVKLNPDLSVTLDENAFVPLHIPKNGYKVISNCEIYEATKKALDGIDADIVTAGTLGAGKRFFLSVDLRGESNIEIRRIVQGVAHRDEVLAYLNMITSHDGTLAAKGYDSTVRIVCQNTLNWSLQAAGEVGFSVYHTAGAEVAVERMGELINAILRGRAQFKNTMELLDSQAVGAADAYAIALAYFVIGQSAGKESLEYEVSKKSRNAAEEIATLFSRGRGNFGRTAYDLLNGATDYWTNGNGTGKKTQKWEKVGKANFGGAAEHKSAFVNLLVGRDLKELAEIGRKAESVSIKAD